MTVLSQDFRFRSLVVKSKGPVDGDGDGFVYDGKPNMRPATPAEMEAGRLMREAKAGGGGTSKPSEPASAQKQRVGLYDSAIKAAQSPQDIEAIAQALGQDKKLGGDDRVRITNALEAKSDQITPGGPKKPEASRGGTITPPRDPTKRKTPKAPEKAPEPQDAAPDGKPEADGWDEDELEDLKRRVQDPALRDELIEAIEGTSTLDDAEKKRMIDAIKRFAQDEGDKPAGEPKTPQGTPKGDDQQSEKATDGSADVDMLPDRDQDSARANDDGDVDYDEDEEPPSYEEVKQYVERDIGNAETPLDLDEVMWRVGETEGLTDGQKETLKAAAMDRLNQMVAEAKVEDGGHGAKIVADDRLEVAKAQQAHFKKGGSIADAPAAGLWNHVRSDPDRFEVKANGTAGKSANFWVTDKKTGERWMFKEGMFDGYHFDGAESGEAFITPDHQDVFNEVMAAEMMKQAGFDMPDTKFASSPDGGVAMMAQRHYGEQFGVDLLDPETEGRAHYIGRGENARMKKDAMESLAKGEDPGAVARMVTIDYLMNNSVDRHVFNAMLSRGGDGELRMAIIDHGMAFSGGTSQDANRPDIGEVGPDQVGGDEFMDRYSTRGWNPSQVLGGINGRDKAALKSQLETELDGMMKVDTKAVRTRMERQGDLSERQREIMETWLDEFEYRRTWMKNNLDTMVDKIATKGGW